MITRKVAPALAAGCSIVVKPAEATPLTALAFQRLAFAAGIPEGAFAVLTTLSAPAVGAELCKNPIVRKLSFTGRSEEHTSDPVTNAHLVCRLLLEKKKQ